MIKRKKVPPVVDSEESLEKSDNYDPLDDLSDRVPSSDTEDTNEVAGGDFENDDKADPGGYDNEADTARVTFQWGDDAEIVRNLPAKRVKRSKRKRVGGWASRVLQALVASVAAMATPVMSEAKKILIDPMADYSDHIDKISRPEDLPEGPALLEIFAGSAHLTMEFAKQGYTVLEPRDILLGHDLRLREEQESVLGTSKPVGRDYYGLDYHAPNGHLGSG